MVSAGVIVVGACLLIMFIYIYYKQVIKHEFITNKYIYAGYYPGEVAVPHEEPWWYGGHKRFEPRRSHGLPGPHSPRKRNWWWP